MVECKLPKLEVAGSNPVPRSLLCDRSVSATQRGCGEKDFPQDKGVQGYTIKEGMTESPEVFRGERQKGNVSFPMERREPEANDDVAGSNPVPRFFICDGQLQDTKRKVKS